MKKKSLVGKTIGTVLVTKEYNKTETKTRMCDCECLECGEKFSYSKCSLIKTKRHPKCSKAIYDPNKAIGKRYNQLVVIEFAYKNKYGQNFYKCKCDCGRTEILSIRAIRHGAGHCRNRQHNNMYDIINKKFGKLKVIKEIGTTKYGQRQFLCKCDCGNEKIILGSNLIHGESTSCGCNLDKYYKEGTHLKYIMQQEAYPNSKSGIKGVWKNKKGYWYAIITVRGERITFYGGSGLEGKNKAIQWRKQMVNKYHKPIIEKYKDVMKSEKK